MKTYAVTVTVDEALLCALEAELEVEAMVPAGAVLPAPVAEVAARVLKQALDAGYVMKSPFAKRARGAA